jgi:hypothetical protein
MDRLKQKETTLTVSKMASGQSGMTSSLLTGFGGVAIKHLSVHLNLQWSFETYEI